jgi:hypothetical protein
MLNVLIGLIKNMIKQKYNMLNLCCGSIWMHQQTTMKLTNSERLAKHLQTKAWILQIGCIFIFMLLLKKKYTTQALQDQIYTSDFSNKAFD